MRLYFSKDKLNSSQMHYLTDQIKYSVSGITSCNYNEAMSRLEVEVSDPTRTEHIYSVITKLAETVQNVRLPKSQTVLTMPNQAAGASQSVVSTQFDISTKRDLVFKVFNMTENALLNFAMNRGISLRRYPSLIPNEALHKCDYFNSFPQNVYMVSEFPHELERLELVRHNDPCLVESEPSGYSLSPAVCFHCYEELSGQSVSIPFIMSAISNCFRHEVSWRVGGARQREFTMIEIVFLGTESEVEKIRADIMQDVWNLFIDLGLYGEVKSASDPFFFPQDAGKAQYQLMMGMKYELIATVNGESISVASFNNVKNTLCEKFSITTHDGETPSSGCVAFGVDRWTYALIGRYGEDINKWPKSVLRALHV